GWAIPSGATLDRQAVGDQAEGEGMFRLLEGEVIPAFVERDADGVPQRGVEMMRASIRHIATEFAARRMVIDYFNTAYAPGARRGEEMRPFSYWGGLGNSSGLLDRVAA